MSVAAVTMSAFCVVEETSCVLTSEDDTKIPRVHQVDLAPLVDPGQTLATTSPERTPSTLTCGGGASTL